MRHTRISKTTLYLCTVFACLAVPVSAQTVDDGLMVARGELVTGTVFTFDRWDEHWEGNAARLLASESVAIP